MQNKSYPRCLFKLSNKQLCDLKKNSIHVSGIGRIGNRIQYSNILYIGNNLRIQERKLNINGIEEEVKHVKVNKSKRNIFCITTNISELLKLKSDTIIIPSSNRYEKNMQIVDEMSDDDIVLICYASIAPKHCIYNMDFDATL